MFFIVFLKNPSLWSHKHSTMMTGKSDRDPGELQVGLRADWNHGSNKGGCWQDAEGPGLHAECTLPSARVSITSLPLLSASYHCFVSLFSTTTMYLCTYHPFISICLPTI